MPSTTRRVRVLAVNDYNLDHAREKVERGIPVRHHLWGIHELQQDDRLDVRILPFSKWPSLNRLVDLRTGDIDQQLRIWCDWKFDVVYAANYNVVMGLALLRRMKLFRKPIVAASFTVPPSGRLTRMCMEGFSHVVCLSSLQMNSLRGSYPHLSDRFSHCCWGWDTAVQPARGSVPGGLILSAGKTMRDYATLLAALRESGLPAQIVCPREYLRIDAGDIPDNCQVLSTGDVWALQDNEMSDLINRAAAIAIPLQMRDHQPHGLTSLLEAMAHGKPVLMTRNPYIDIDIEKIGCGYWIEPNSINGWIEGIKKITRDPAKAADMGAKGRCEIEKAFSITKFSEHIGNVILNVV